MSQGVRFFQTGEINKVAVPCVTNGVPALSVADLVGWAVCLWKAAVSRRLLCFVLICFP